MRKIKRMKSGIWSKAEEIFLLENAHKGMDFLLENLNRSGKAIEGHHYLLKGTSILGKEKHNRYSYKVTSFTKEERSFLLENAHKGVRFIAEALGRSSYNIRREGNLEGVRFSTNNDVKGMCVENLVEFNLKLRKLKEEMKLDTCYNIRRKSYKVIEIYEHFVIMQCKNCKETFTYVEIAKESI